MINKCDAEALRKRVDKVIVKMHEANEGKPNINIFSLACRIDHAIDLMEGRAHDDRY